MQGDFVCVRGHDNRSATLRVWKDAGEIIQVLRPEDYATAIALGVPAVWPVGVRRSDVFVLQPERMLDQAVEAWTQLLPY